MPRRIYLAESAQRDAEEIWRYIAFSNPSSADPVAAKRVLDAIEETAGNLADFPDRGKIGERELYRTVVEGYSQYLMLYRFSDEVVEILRVFRADLDWTRVVEEL